MRGTHRAHNPARVFPTLAPQKYPPKNPESTPPHPAPAPLLSSPRGRRAQRGSSAAPPKFPRVAAGQPQPLTRLAERGPPAVWERRRRWAGARRLPGSYNSAAAPGRAARLRSGGERGGKEEMSGRRIGGRGRKEPSPRDWGERGTELNFPGGAAGAPGGGAHRAAAPRPPRGVRSAEPRVGAARPPPPPALPPSRATWYRPARLPGPPPGRKCGAARRGGSTGLRARGWGASAPPAPPPASSATWAWGGSGRKFGFFVFAFVFPFFLLFFFFF